MSRIRDTARCTFYAWAALVLLGSAGLAEAQDDAAPQPTAQTRMVFVTPDGDDEASGLTPDDAVATIARGLALLRDGSPDWLALERGHDYQHTGDDMASLGTAEQAVVLTAWGEGPTPRLFLESDAHETLTDATDDGHAVVHDVTVVPAWTHISTFYRNANLTYVSFDGSRSVPSTLGNQPVGTQPGHTQSGPARVYTHGIKTELFVVVNGNPSLRLTDNAMLANPHSGDGHFAAASDSRAWVMWIEDQSVGNGTPTWAIELDASGNELGRWQVGIADPARPGAWNFPSEPNIHAQPQIFRDDQGTLHMILGAHHGKLLYAQSNTPDTLANGWTDWVEIGDTQPSNPAYGYTYPSIELIDGTFHIVARWTNEYSAHQLVYFAFSPDTGDSTDNFVVVQGPNPHDYCVFYHDLRRAGSKLMVDYNIHFYTRDNTELRAGDSGTWELDLDE